MRKIRRGLVVLFVMLLISGGSYLVYHWNIDLCGSMPTPVLGPLAPPSREEPNIPPRTEDWVIISDDMIVSEDEEFVNKTILLTGNLTIERWGTLMLKNSTLIINCSTDGEYLLKVAEGGSFSIYNTIVTSINKTFGYRFEIYGNVTMEKCEVSYLGDYAGVKIYSDNVTISNTTIKYSRGNGIVSKNSSPTIINSIITLNNYDGILCYDGSPNIVNNIITSNSWRGIIYKGTGSPNIGNNTISHNQIGIVIPSSIKIMNSVIDHNSIGIACISSQIVNCTISNNDIGVKAEYLSSAIVINSNILNSTMFDFVVEMHAHPKVYNTTLDESKIKLKHLYSSLTIDGRVIRRSIWEFPIGVVCGFLIAIAVVFIFLVVDVLIEKRKKQV